MTEDSNYSTLKNLRAQREEKIDRRKKARVIFYSSLMMFIAMLAVSVFFCIGYFNADNISNPIWLMSIIYTLVFMCGLPMSRERLRELEQDIQTIDFEIDLEQYEVGNFERRAEKVLRINQIQLQRYYDTNLRQNSWVFLIGVLCIVAGIVVVAATLYLVVKVAGSTDEKIIVSVLGAVGSILSNFIAAVYLKMHTAATSTLTSFHQRLINSQSLFLGNLLASRIEDEQMRMKTLAELSMRVIGTE